MHCLDQYEGNYYFAFHTSSLFYLNIVCVIEKLFSDFLIKLRNTTGDNTRVNCGCYPLCDDVSYSIEEENKIIAAQWYVVQCTFYNT